MDPPRDRVKGIHGVVADLIDVPKEYEIAIETALGGSIQNIVTDSEQTAKILIEHLKKNRDYAVDRLNQMPMIKAYRPHATYLLYVDIRAFGMKSEEFTDYMKEKVKLAVVSGGEKFFGSGSEGYIRICFATSHEILEEGLNRLEKGIDMLIREKNLEK